MLALGTLVLLRDPETFARIRNEPGAVDRSSKNSCGT